ncbi:hypothetical protein F5Y06DRAFT_248107 [Hypoxylon sp. FL0890]|nr:hypothetical protein F5Y06DRAFT_248107 [Hypoxylon sp. FL0890]
MSLAASTVALATIVCTYVFTFLALLSLAIHGYMRLNNPNRFSLEDFSTSLAVIITLALVGQITWAVVDEGQGQHVSDVTQSQFELTAKSLLVSEALWALVNTFIRLSALILLHKVFSATAVNRFQSLFLISVSILHGVAALLTAILICRPIRASWDSHVRGGMCGNQTAAYVGLEACGLLIDIAILALPFRPVLTLQMRTRRKLSVLLLLSAGVVVTIITALRIAALHRVNSSDFSYDQGYLGLLSTLGALLGIISCCATSFAQFFRHLKSSTSQHLLLRLLRSSFRSGLRETIDRMYYYRAASGRSGIAQSRNEGPTGDDSARKQDDEDNEDSEE